LLILFSYPAGKLERLSDNSVRLFIKMTPHGSIEKMHKIGEKYDSPYFKIVLNFMIQFIE